jgi:hypothetical protein
MTRFQVAFAWMVCALAVGCGPKVASVYGKITYKGEPVTAGTITFAPKVPADQIDAGKPGFASPDNKGEFQVSTFQRDDGALVGTHLVTYAPPPASSSGDPVKRAEEMKLHHKYKNLSLPQGYTFEVKSGRNDITLELKQ